MTTLSSRFLPGSVTRLGVLRGVLTVFGVDSRHARTSRRRGFARSVRGRSVPGVFWSVSPRRSSRAVGVSVETGCHYFLPGGRRRSRVPGPGDCVSVGVEPLGDGRPRVPKETEVSQEEPDLGLQEVHEGFGEHLGEDVRAPVGDRGRETSPVPGPLPCRPDVTDKTPAEALESRPSPE